MIAPLPAATVRALSSGQVVTTPASIVKELVENALDAGATALTVELDPTTVGRVLVHDNGAGVPVDDRALMCLRHTTSKIASFADLADRRVRTLGFRGEALASLAAVAGEMEITTRTATDVVAGRWSVRADGSAHSFSRAPQPVGTKVVVLDVYARLPVRKKTYAKEAKATLARVRALLRAYALLRRGVRVSFNLMRSAAPPTVYVGGRTLRDSVLQNFGKDGLADADVMQAVDLGAGWAVDAVLPAPAGEGSGQIKHTIIAIDGRPMAPTLPTCKKLLKTFRSYVRSQGTGLLFVDFCATKHAYDVNVEPAKDDVLVYDEAELVAVWGAFLAEYYGGAEASGSGDGHAAAGGAEDGRAEIQQDGSADDHADKIQDGGQAAEIQDGGRIAAGHGGAEHIAADHIAAEHTAADHIAADHIAADQRAATGEPAAGSPEYLESPESPADSVVLVGPDSPLFIDLDVSADGSQRVPDSDSEAGESASALEAASVSVSNDEPDIASDDDSDAASLSVAGSPRDEPFSAASAGSAAATPRQALLFSDRSTVSPATSLAEAYSGRISRQLIQPLSPHTPRTPLHAPEPRQLSLDAFSSSVPTPGSPPTRSPHKSRQKAARDVLANRKPVAVISSQRAPSPEPPAEPRFMRTEPTLDYTYEYEWARAVPLLSSSSYVHAYDDGVWNASSAAIADALRRLWRASDAPVDDIELILPRLDLVPCDRGAEDGWLKYE
ncbi:uncharacterized protein V1510DRAFT_393290 [Dipodascopsis tothii]|uniref:uncharacterized protein n=1 Tax=Dipodascopsis tothii TaxID=44089 RepID=UPI0034CDB086